MNETKFDFEKEIRNIKVLHIEVKTFEDYHLYLQIPHIHKSWNDCVKFENTTNHSTLNKINVSKLAPEGIGKLTILIKAFLERNIQLPNKYLPNFLGISTYSLQKRPFKYYESQIFKQSGGRYKEGKCLAVCQGIVKKWSRRWIIISGEGIIYMLSEYSENARETLLFDQSINVVFGFRNTGRRKGICIKTATRKFTIEAENHFEMLEILKALQIAAQNSPYVKINRFMSFAPVRENNSTCKWFINGEKYFGEMCDALFLAKHEVLITDWWLSPEFFLKRPVTPERNQETRLDRVLAKLAHQGVQIKILVYREIKLALNNDSEYVEIALRKISNGSPNIKVLRHPNNLIFLWSHHEKMVVIDHEIGFMGGLDLCYGRFDYSHHPLADDNLEEIHFPGIDYSNSRVMDFRNVRKYYEPLIPRTSCPRMPWRDIAIKATGPVVQDMARHFIQYWNFANVDIASNNREKNLIDLGVKKKEKLGFSKINKLLHKIRLPTQIANKLGGKMEIQRNEITMNEYLKRVNSLNEENMNIVDYDDNVNNSELEIHSQDFDKMNLELGIESKEKASKSFLLNDTRNFRSIEDKNSLRNSFQKSDKMLSPSKINLSPINDLPLLKASSEHKPQKGFASLKKTKTFAKDTNFEFNQDFSALIAESHEKAGNINFDKTFLSQREIKEDSNSKKNLKSMFLNAIKKLNPMNELNDKFYRENLMRMSVDSSSKMNISNGTCRCQLLRSASRWSIGLHTNSFEMSIQTAYLQIIESAKHFIYIENQFFISSTAGSNVKNSIAKAIAMKIEEAKNLGKKFKVLVLLPLMPGFEGEVKNSPVLRIQMYWQYMTIKRGQDSLFNLLLRKNINPEEYIKFIGLRNHEILNKTPVTEIIYVHSKVLLA